MPSVAILIVSYAPDIPWLECNLRSIRKFARGFGTVALCVPEDQRPQFEPIAAGYGCVLHTYACIWSKAFNHHQVMKCHADLMAHGADYVAHTDSDCIFTEPVTPVDFFVDGKPVLVIESYERARPEMRRAWREPTERALGFSCRYETMCRHPAVHPVWLYPALREHIAARHGDFTQYVLAQKNSFPMGFSEFNALGSFAREKFGDCYHWHIRGETPDLPSKLRQAWSHGLRSPPGTPERQKAMETLAAFAQIVA